ncbi:MAG: VOC family protein [Actinobacteria bacterium]|nr:VOC family protein [Actinomycetota bacterium]
MTEPGVPEGYRTLSPYLVVPDVDAAVGFLAGVFGAVERQRMTGEGGGVHCELELGDSVLMVGAGGDTSFPAMVHVYVEDADAVYERALAAGATSAAEPHDTSFGDHRVAFEDPWGSQWWVATRVSSKS